MAADVISNLTGNLDVELEKARKTLQGVDDNIKKLFGKEADEVSSFGQRGRRPPPVTRSAPYPLSRLTKPSRQVEDDADLRGRLQSRIVSSVKEKSREEVIAEQRGDRSGLTRNRRMFGALLGTLQQFKQDETKLKDKEEKRAQIEAKLDEAAQNERDSVKKEKQQLIRDRQLKLTEIRRLEIKKQRLDDLEHWEVQTKHLSNFIRTDSKPHIFYLPKTMTPVMECRLEKSKQLVTEMIANKRKMVLEDLDNYEQRSKRYWERRIDGQDVRKLEMDPVDGDIEEELKAIMKSNEVINALPEVSTDVPVNIPPTSVYTDKDIKQTEVKHETDDESSRTEFEESMELDPKNEQVNEISG